MGGKSSAPAPPDYASLLPLQEAAFNRTFNNMLGASRVNSVTPYGRTTWTPPPGVYNQGGGSTGQPPPATPGTKTAQGGSEPTFQAAVQPSINPNLYFGGALGGQETSGLGPGGLPPPAYAAVQPPGGQPSGPNGFGQPWTVTQELSPEQQAILDSNQRLAIKGGGVAEGMLNNVAGQYQNPRDFASGLMGFQQFDPAQYQQQDWRGPQYNTNINSRDDAERAYYNREMAYLNPELNEQERRASDRLAAMGFNVNDPGYQNAMGDVYDSAAKQRSVARNNAIVQGGNEATQELQRGLMTEDPRFRAAAGEAQFGYNAAQQGQQFRANENQRGFGQSQARVQQQIADYLMPMNVMNAFRQGNQVQLPGMPAQFNTPNMQTADPMQAAQNTYAGQLGQWNANQAGSNNFMNGLFSLGGAALGGPAGGLASKLFGL